MVMRVERLLCGCSARLVAPDIYHRIDEVAVSNCVVTHKARLIAVVAFLLLEESAWQNAPQSLQALEVLANETVEQFHRHAVEMKLWRCFAKFWLTFRAQTISSRYPCGAPAVVFGYRLQHRGLEFKPFHDSLKDPHPFDLPADPVYSSDLRQSVVEAMQQASDREFLDAPLSCLVRRFPSLHVYADHFKPHFLPENKSVVELANAVCHYGSKLFVNAHVGFVLFPLQLQQVVVEIVQENFGPAYVACRDHGVVEFRIRRIHDGGFELGLFVTHADGGTMCVLKPATCSSLVLPPQVTAVLGIVVDPADYFAVSRLVAAIAAKHLARLSLAFPSRVETAVLYRVLQSHPKSVYIVGCGIASLGVRCADKKIIVERSCKSIAEWSVDECYGLTSKGGVAGKELFVPPQQKVVVAVPLPRVKGLGAMLNPSELRKMLLHYWHELVENHRGNVLLQPSTDRMYLHPENNDVLKYVLRHHSSYYEIRGCGVVAVFVSAQRGVSGLMEPSYFVERICSTFVSFSVRECFANGQLRPAEGWLNTFVKRQRD